LEQRKKKVQCRTPGVSMGEIIEPNLNIHYQLSNSQRDPVDLYTYSTVYQG
jgi:hypothetical protein